MRFRFFTKVKNNKDNVKLMVLIFDDAKKTLDEFELREGELIETSEVMKSLITGSTEIDEIDEEEAQKLYPNVDIEELLGEYRNG
jgi:hypothetical protein